MMIGGRNMNMMSRSTSSAYVFTASQWQELEQQLLTFKYLMSGIPVPTELITTFITNPCSSHHQTLPFGWGCFQMGYGRKLDPEPGRCRRTDGKKWRCTKEACPDSKYCEKHMHRGKNKSKKPSSQVVPTTTPNFSTTPKNTILSTPTVNQKPAVCVAPSSAISLPPQITTSYPQYKTQKLQSTNNNNNNTSFYPFLSPNNEQSLSFSPTFNESTQPATAPPHWLLDPYSSYDQPKKDIRYLNEMKGSTASERIMGPLQEIGYNHINKGVKEVRFGVDNNKDDDDETQKQLYHHFLGE